MGIQLSTDYLKGLGREDGLTDYDQLKFKIYDSTEGTVISGNENAITSQDAEISVKMKIDIEDGVKPTVVINPLYWNSKADNSLYQNSTANGHIELGSDLDKEKFVGTTFTETSGLMDKDDKVSGKVTFTGTAYDDVRLEGLNIKFDNFNFGKGNGKDFETIVTMVSERPIGKDRRHSTKQ